MRHGSISGRCVVAAALGIAATVAGCGSPASSDSSASPALAAPSVGRPTTSAAPSAAIGMPSSMPTPATAGADGTTLAWLVVGEHAPTPAPVIVVGDAAGREERRIQLRDTPLAMYASAVAPTVLVRCSDSWLVANLADGSTMTLDLGAYPRLWEPLYTGRRYWALGEPSSSGNVLVIDSLSGIATTALDAHTGHPIGSAREITASPKEDFLETNPDSSSSWLIPAGDPAKARSLGDSDSSPGRFSAAGEQVVYSTSTAGTTRVFIEATAGGESRDVATLQENADVAFTADPSKLLVVGRSGISLLDAGTGAAQLLASQPALPVFSIVQSPDLAHFLVVKLDGDLNAHEFLVDPAAGSVREVPDLAGLLSAETSDQSVLLQTPPSASVHRYALLDWSTGEVRPLDDLSAVRGPIRSVPVVDGGHLITSGSTAWLVSADGTARELDAGIQLVAQVSPDGARVVTSTLQGQVYRQKVHDLRSASSTAIGAGYGTVFVAP